MGCACIKTEMYGWDVPTQSLVRILLHTFLNVGIGVYMGWEFVNHAGAGGC